MKLVRDNLYPYVGTCQTTWIYNDVYVDCSLETFEVLEEMELAMRVHQTPFHIAGAIYALTN